LSICYDSIEPFKFQITYHHKNKFHSACQSSYLHKLCMECQEVCHLIEYKTDLNKGLLLLVSWQLFFLPVPILFLFFCSIIRKNNGTCHSSFFLGPKSKNGMGYEKKKFTLEARESGSKGRPFPTPIGRGKKRAPFGPQSSKVGGGGGCDLVEKRLLYVVALTSGRQASRGKANQSMWDGS